MEGVGGESKRFRSAVPRWGGASSPPHHGFNSILTRLHRARAWSHISGLSPARLTPFRMPIPNPGWQPCLPPLGAERSPQDPHPGCLKVLGRAQNSEKRGTHRATVDGDRTGLRTSQRSHAQGQVWGRGQNSRGVSGSTSLPTPACVHRPGSSLNPLPGDVSGSFPTGRMEAHRVNLRTLPLRRGQGVGRKIATQGAEAWLPWRPAPCPQTPH